MRWLGRLVLATLMICGIYVGGWLWAVSGNAPYSVGTLYFGPNDHEVRCAEDRRKWGAAACGDLGRQRVFEGIYFDEFEGQIFLDGERPAESYTQRGPLTWLTFDEQSVPEQLGTGVVSTRVWHMRFIGRKTVRSGHYGHFGMSCHEILVDRVLWARPQQAAGGYRSDSLIQQNDDPLQTCPDAG